MSQSEIKALYNEIDPFAAEWLRQLIRNGCIAHGIVDERSIEDLEPDYVSRFTQVHFFAGIGVWSHALRQAGWGDDRSVWTASCPCQPFSAAGKGKGFDDERHLWPSLFWLIKQCRPNVVIGEQVASKVGLEWIDIVSTDLEASNYAVGAVDTCAAGFGAPHIRQRLYWVGHTNSSRREPQQKNEREHGEGMEPTGREQELRVKASGGDVFWSDAEFIEGRDGKRRPIQRGTFPLVDGFANRVGRLRGYGNAIVAPQAQAFIESFMETSQ